MQRVVPACTCRVSGTALSHANENGPAEQQEQQAEEPSCATVTRTRGTRSTCKRAERSKSATQAAGQLKAVPCDCRECSGESTQHGEHGRFDAANRRASLQTSGGGESRGLVHVCGLEYPPQNMLQRTLATHACHGRVTLRRAPLRSRGRTIAVPTQNAVSKRCCELIINAKRLVVVASCGDAASCGKAANCGEAADKTAV